MWFDTLTKVWGRKTVLLVIFATAASSFHLGGQVSAAEARLKSGLKLTKADRRTLQFCPELACGELVEPVEGLNCPNPDEPKPLQKDLIVTSKEGFALDSTIEVGSDITTNQIWTANNTYHITANISVKALLVVEPGTTIKFASGRSMSINDGGTLISAGTPGNPIIYTSDKTTPDYNDYNCPIQIEETASASTKVTYNYIAYANTGIKVLNNRLDNPIENNYLYRNFFGIREYGIEHTDIINNLVYDMWNYGIDVNMASTTSQGSANSHILIQNNTSDDCNLGIIVRGVANYDDAGEVTLTNNIVSNSRLYGLALVNGYMNELVTNTGYYNNITDTLYVYSEYNPVYETENPYETGTGILPVCYLRQNSTFINASDEYIEQTCLIGKTTAISSFPDSNLTDLGFHYPNWQFSNAGSSSLTADFDNNLKVDFNDLKLFAGYWLYDYNDNQKCEAWDFNDDGLISFYDLDIFANSWLTEYDFVDFADFAKYWRKQVDYRFQDRRFDLVADNIVNFKDFSMLANQWRQETTSFDPNIQIQISGDPNNGYVDIGVTGWSSDTQCVFLLADGEYIGDIFGFRDGYTIGMDISKFGNQLRQLKMISVDSNSHITCSNIANVIFSKPLYYCFMPPTYVKNQPLPFAAFNSGAGNITAKAYANGGTLVWSQTYSGNAILDSIPAAITNQYAFDYVSFDNSSEQSLAKKVTDPQPSGNVLALIVLPKWKFIWRDSYTIAQVVGAFIRRGIPYAKLSGGKATYDNVEWYARNKYIKYLYIGSTDGDYMEGSTYRTGIELSDGWVVSIKRSDYPNPNNAPSWCTILSDENDVKSFATMGFWALEYAFFDCCYTGRLKIDSSNHLVVGNYNEIYDIDAPHSDMSFALGMSQTSASSFYQGWYDEAWSAFLLQTSYQYWTQREFYYLGSGENLYEALNDTIWDQTDFRPEAPVYNYVLRGQGYWDDIVLDNW